MKIITWNVNSIRQRLGQVLNWLSEHRPDIVLLQETKCLEEAFPYLEIEELGYNVAAAGQKTFNGVAILSKFPLEDVVKTLPGDGPEEARYIEAVVSAGRDAWRVASVYVPNGQDPNSGKFPYKLSFLDRIQRHLEALLEHREKLVIGGDWNVAPDPIDVHDPKLFKDAICFHPEERRRLHGLLNTGFTDAFRVLYPNTKAFSWWDYRSGLERNAGLRIDYLLLSPEAADMLQSCAIDESARHHDRASDHAPVMAEFGT